MGLEGEDGLEGESVGLEDGSGLGFELLEGGEAGGERENGG